MSDLDTLVASIRATVGTDLAAWPGGWPGEIDAALLDAVFSIRARYGGPSTGVRAVVNRWRDYTGRPADDLRALANQKPEDLADLLDNKSKLRGRLKAAVVADAASSLVGMGLIHARDFSVSGSQKRAYLQVRGCGPVTWAYFGMLLGHPDVKADTWILRFVRSALGHDVNAESARVLVKQAAERLGVNASQLDHAIWSHQRSLRN